MLYIFLLFVFLNKFFFISITSIMAHAQESQPMPEMTTRLQVGVHGPDTSPGIPTPEDEIRKRRYFTMRGIYSEGSLKARYGFEYHVDMVKKDPESCLLYFAQLNNE